jgi:uncharacterized protein with NAD-binding domain and iron-sulfur cluster
MQQRKPRVVVVGGGLGALSAVYWLTEATPRWRERYESIIVYQTGGGWAASAPADATPPSTSASRNTASTYGSASTRTRSA